VLGDRESRRQNADINADAAYFATSRTPEKAL
jgi:hypothetical protein